MNIFIVVLQCCVIAAVNPPRLLQSRKRILNPQRNIRPLANSHSQQSDRTDSSGSWNSGQSLAGRIQYEYPEYHSQTENIGGQVVERIGTPAGSGRIGTPAGGQVAERIGFGRIGTPAGGQVAEPLFMYFDANVEKNGENIYETFKLNLLNYGFNVDETYQFGAVTDEGSNMRAAFSNARAKYLKCSCHILNTCLKHVRSFIASARRIMPLRIALGNKLTAPVETRWLSNLFMIDNFVKNLAIIRENVEEHDRKNENDDRAKKLLPDYEALMPSVNDFTILSDIMTHYKKPMYDLQQDTDVTISLIVPRFAFLRKQIKSYVLRNTDDLACYLGQSALEALDIKIQDMNQEIILAASFLDPFVKDQLPGISNEVSMWNMDNARIQLPTMHGSFLPGNGNGNKMNLRVEIIENLLNASGDGNSAKINSLRQAIRRNKSDMADTATKSLDVLRQIFQHEITDEIRQIVDRHLLTTFAPAIENLKRNGYDVSKSVINTLCVSILDGAKSAYGVQAEGPEGRPDERDADGRPICIPSLAVLKAIQSHQNGEHRQSRGGGDDAAKAYESDDNESDSSMVSYNSTLSGVPSNAYGAGRVSGGRPKKRGRPRKTDMDSGRSGTPIIQGTHPVTMSEAMKWNPERIRADETRFVLASKANKILGGGHRNQIFAKYSRFFRYAADEEDKQWLFDRSVSTRMSGKVLLMVLDDCLEIAQLEGAPAQSRADLKRYSFALTERICEKMRRDMAVPFEKLKTRIVAANVPPPAAAAALLLQQQQHVQQQQHQNQQHFGGMPQMHAPPPTAMGGFNYM